MTKENPVVKPDSWHNRNAFFFLKKEKAHLLYSICYELEKLPKLYDLLLCDIRSLESPVLPLSQNKGKLTKMLQLHSLTIVQSSNNENVQSLALARQQKIIL